MKKSVLLLTSILIFGCIVKANAQLGSQVLTDANSTLNMKTNTIKYDKIIELIKKNYKDPNLTKLYTKKDGEKVYEYTHDENIGFQGRACWKTDHKYFSFFRNGIVGFITAMTIDLIEPDGSHGARVYTRKPKGKEMHYLLVNDIIYTWTKDDYSDLEKCLIYDSKTDVLKQENDNKITYKATFC